MGLLASAEERIGEQLFRRSQQGLVRGLKATRHVYEGEVSIPYLCIDRGHSETLVNLPGFSDEKENSLVTARSLSKRFNVIIPDTVGFGETERDPNREHTLVNHARWVAGFLKHLDRGPVWLMGNSLGGAIASVVAFEYPEWVVRCLPVGPGAYMHSQSNPLLEEIREGHNLFYVTTNEEYRVFVQRLFHRKMRPIPFLSAALRARMMKERDWYAHVMHQMESELGFDLSDPSASRFSLNHGLADCSVPFHFIWGEFDSFFVADIMNELREEYPQIGTTLIRRCGHAPHLEAPTRLARAVLASDREGDPLREL